MTDAPRRARLLQRVGVSLVLVPPVVLMVAGIYLGWYHLTQGPPTQRVHIRWAPTVTATERARIESEAGLVNGLAFEERTWQYLLRDRSSPNIHRLITDPRVEDTFHIDRRTDRVQLDRPNLSPRLRHWLESDELGHISLALLVLAVAMTVWLRRRTAMAIRDGLGVLGTVFLANSAIFTIGFGAFIATTGGVDIDSHLKFARRLDLLHLPAPHFLFELLVRLIAAAGVSYENAAAVILGLCYGIMAVLIARELNRRLLLTWYHALLLLPATLLATHMFWFTIASHDVYRGYLASIAYHNPTQQLNKVFALWIMFLFLPTFVAGRAIAWRTSIIIGMLCVLSTIAKPSFLIAFLPAVALWEARNLVRLPWTPLLRFTATVVVPSAAVLLWQARIAYGSDAAARIAYGVDAASSIVIAPFSGMDPAQIPLRFSMSLAFPIVVALAAVRTRTWNARLAFVWVFMAVALAMSLLLTESGRLDEGNFMWTGQTAVFLAYVESVLFILSAPLSEGWKRLSWGVFAGHVACGVLWYALLFTPYWHDFTRL